MPVYVHTFCNHDIPQQLLNSLVATEAITINFVVIIASNDLHDTNFLSYTRGKWLVCIMLIGTSIENNTL